MNWILQAETLRVRKLRTIIYTCVWTAREDMLLGHDISNLFRHILQGISVSMRSCSLQVHKAHLSRSVNHYM